MIVETPSEGVSGAGHARDITKLRDLAPVALTLTDAQVHAAKAFVPK